MKNPLPGKSREKEPGTVVQFSILSRVDEYDSKTVAEIEFAQYATALQSARELGCTGIAREHHNFFRIPTVLVIARSRDKYEEVTSAILSQEGMEDHWVLGSIDPNEKKKVKVPARDLTAEQFLAGVEINAALGTYTYFLEGERLSSMSTAVRMGRSLFDFVIGMPDTPPQWSFGNKNYIMVSSPTSAKNVRKNRENAVLYTPTLYDLRKGMNENSYDLFSTSPSLGSSVLRAAGQKIARHILDLYSSPLVLPKDKFFTTPEKSEQNDYEVNSIARAFVAAQPLQLPLPITRDLEDLQRSLEARKAKRDKKQQTESVNHEQPSGRNDELLNANAPTLIAHVDTAALSPRFKTLRLRVESLEERWMKYELNPQLLLTYPKMADATCPETAQFILAWSELSAWSKTAENELDDASVVEFERVIRNAEAAFITAEANARKAAQSYLSNDERKKIELAKDLMAIATDESATTNERTTAFKRANRELEGVLPPLNPKIIGLLEA